MAHGGDIINIDSLYFILANMSTCEKVPFGYNILLSYEVSARINVPPLPPRHTSSRYVRVTDNRRRHLDNGHSGFSARRSTRHLRTNGLCQREHRTRPRADSRRPRAAETVAGPTTDVIRGGTRLEDIGRVNSATRASSTQLNGEGRVGGWALPRPRPRSE